VVALGVVARACGVVSQNPFTWRSPLEGMDYDTSLDRALDRVPDFGGDDARLTVPDAAAQADGAFTRFTNLADVADALNRDPQHLHRFVQRELGTNGKLEAGRARYNGRFSGGDFDDAVEAYVAEYVTCSECGLPDTRLVKEDRTPMLRCDACGAFRPVAKRRRTTQTRDPDAVEEGETYEVKITGTGRKGDGVAERGKYTIFVTGAREGQVVDIYVESVSGNLAFAQLA
jgi:translation initiation factor 2 subunit 2